MKEKWGEIISMELMRQLTAVNCTKMKNTATLLL